MFFFIVAVRGFEPRIAWLQGSKPLLAAALAKFVNGTQKYLVMTALFGAIVGVLDSAALWLIGVPLPLVWGFFSFITNFIPNIGFVIGIVPPALLALLDSGWEEMVLVILVYSVLNVTIQTFIQPRFVGNSVGLSAEMTYMSLVVWAFLLGALGALLAVPDDAAAAGLLHRRGPAGRLGRPADRRPGRLPRPGTGSAPRTLPRRGLPHASLSAARSRAFSSRCRRARSTALWVPSHHGARWLRSHAHSATTGRVTAWVTPVASTTSVAPRTSCGPRGQSVRCTSTPRTSTVITPPSRAARGLPRGSRASCARRSTS